MIFPEFDNWVKSVTNSAHNLFQDDGY